MAKKVTTKNVTQNQLFTLLATFGLILTIVLLAVAVGVWAGNDFAINQVRTQLVQEKISFPPAGSAGLLAAEFPGLQQYGGQPVDNGGQGQGLCRRVYLGPYDESFRW